MPFRKIFLVIAGGLGLSCAVFCTPLVATPASALPPSAGPTTLPPARIQKTLDDYKRWLNLLGERDAVA